MKKEWIWLSVLSLCIVLIIPWSIVRWQKEDTTKVNIQIRVLMPDGGIETLPMEEYLVGVVAAEMPAEFELEALKAQAIAARTYAAKRLSKGNTPDTGYDVDTTILTQAWLSDTQMKTKWGWLNYLKYRSRLQKAVKESNNKVLVYNGEYLDAFYYSSSGRKATERSEDVWSSPRPYLQNVTSEEDDLQRYVKSMSFTAQELSKKLGIEEITQPLTEEDFQILSRTTAGRARTVRVLEKVYLATQLRTLLGLPSTDIEMTLQSDQLTITAFGNGHAVGMSQWGANDMAKKSIKAEEILAHFYPGSKIMALGQI